MKNNKGFTLIELIAVVVILAVLMMIAVPNVVSTINRNKKESFIEDAKKFRSAVESKILSDTTIDLPNSDSVLVFKLAQIGKSEIEESPYGNKYAKEASFVAVTKEPVQVTITGTSGQQNVIKYQLVYYVHLLACKSDDCDDDDVDSRYAINWSQVENLHDNQRFNYVVQADDCEITTDIPQYIRGKIGNKSVTMYKKK